MCYHFCSNFSFLKCLFVVYFFKSRLLSICWFFFSCHVAFALYCVILLLVYFSFCRHNLLVLVPILNYFSISTIIDKYFDTASYIKVQKWYPEDRWGGIYVAVLSSPPPPAFRPFPRYHVYPTCRNTSGVLGFSVTVETQATKFKWAFKHPRNLCNNLS